MVEKQGYASVAESTREIFREAQAVRLHQPNRELSIG